MEELDRERLFGWGSIAAVLHCDIRTAQRYEKYRNLPVHRIPGPGSARVYAYKDELVRWLDTSNSHPEIDRPSGDQGLPPHSATEADALAVPSLSATLRMRPNLLLWIASPQEFRPLADIARRFSIL